MTEVELLMHEGGEVSGRWCCIRPRRGRYSRCRAERGFESKANRCGMTSVVHYRKSLDERPASIEVAGILVRGFVLASDVPAWLTLRGRAVAWLKPAVRAWTTEDFAAEMSRKPWWRDEWTWLATPIDAPQQIIGSVTLAVREGVAGTMPVVHWLLVDPRWRRRGIGRLLMMQLEPTAWDEGWREIQLETHAGWTDAVAFYQSIGFESVR